MTPDALRYAAILESADCESGRRARLIAAIAATCIAALAITGFFDAARFIEGLPAITQLGSEMIPPDFTRWRNWMKPLLDTLAMSIAGTALAVLISLPLAVLAAPNTAPSAGISRGVRTLLAALRREASF